ncbi:MAG: hypothetical protein OES20_12560 [Gammaproteobacteria bacterium]|nr:hypothetical protein [Gammaproteobacteria bacterium]
MNRKLARLGYLLLVLLSVESAIADAYTGTFSGWLEGEEYQLSISQNETGQYQGELQVAGVVLLLNARRFGDRIAGQIGGADESFGFVANLQGSALIFEDEEGVSITFQRDIDSGNDAGSDRAASDAQAKRLVYVNRVQLDLFSLQELEAHNDLPIADGRYWYDIDTGAWGVEGGPTAGLIYPGLPLPTPMPPDISGGGTGIFINGREIHPLDQQALYQLFGVTYQGDFWMDSQGNLGYVGGPAIVNILQASQAAQSDGIGGSVTHGYDSTYGARGTAAGGMYSGRSATGKSVFWYPGM